MKALLALALAACSSGVIAPRAPIDRVAYPNGKARFEFELRDGVPNGRGRAWHPNGKLASDGTYQDGARNGRFWFYNDDGTFAAQALFVDNEQVWHSTAEHDQPPAEWSEAFVLLPRRTPVDATAVDTAPDLPWDAYRKAPRAYFSTLDRTTALSRAGAQLGVSNARDLDFGAATRLDVFGHYRFGRYGVFAQFSQTQLAAGNKTTLAGRLGTIIAGTYHRALGPATLSTNGGLIMAVGNTDAAGSVASYVGAQQRPTDTALAIPAPFGVRSGASLTSSRPRYLVQLDTGIDWLFGGDENGLDPIARANVGIGFGTRSTMLTAEVDNAIDLLGRHAHLHAVAVGATLAYPMISMSASVALSYAGTMSFLGTVGHDL